MNLLPSFLCSSPDQSPKLWSKLSHIMAVTIELYPLSNRLLDNILADLHFKHGAFLLIEEQIINDVISVGFTSSFKFSYEQIAPLLKYRQLINCQELEDPSLKTLFEQLKIEFIRILRVEEQVEGILILGGQLSDAKLTKKQCELLDGICDELSIALSNSRSYDKIKQFNITLSQAVKSATENLQITNKRLEEIDKAKDEFVSIASHELRTPMTAIRSYAWMALHKPDVVLTEKMIKYLSRILISTERSIDMVNDLLSVSRLESGHMDFKFEPVELPILVSEVVEEMGSKITEKALSVRVIHETVPQVIADHDKVRQVIFNLLGNAIKYTENGGSIEVSFLSDGVMLETHLKDTGRGISADDLGRLFTKFGRLDHTYVATATAGGTGLGLYISKDLIGHMSGRIWASSLGIGKGSTFSFALPIATKSSLDEASQYVKLSPSQVDMLS